MIDEQWLDFLVSPLSQQALLQDKTGKVLRSQDGSEVYPVRQGVPQLLAPVTASVASVADAHRKLDTTFRYREHYEKDAELFDYFLKYEDGASRHEAQRLHELIAAEVPAKAVTILDVGCGSAWVAQTLCPAGKKVFSMDIGSRNPEKALQLYPFPNHFALVADVYALPFRPNTFDVVIASEIIEHVPDPRLFIERLLSVLRPGGKLILTTPFEEKISYSLCIHCNRPTSQHAHLHSFSKDSLAQMVRRDQAGKLMIQSFSNKALVKLQTHTLLRYLPTRIWRLVDQLANVVIPKPARLMMTVEKR